MSHTLNKPPQPTLPPEGNYSELELAWIEEQQPIFPTNQDSNYGAHRAVICGFLQEVADQEQALFSNRFIDTAEEWLGEWEEMFGIPRDQAIDLDRRRATVKGRMQKGLFTRAKREQVIRNVIASTFGPAATLTPEGLTLDATGISLFSGLTTESPNKLIGSSFESSMMLTAVTGSATKSLVTSEHQHGTHAIQVVTGNAGAGEGLRWAPDASAPKVVPGQVDSYSIYAKGASGTVRIKVWYMDAANSVLSQPTSSNYTMNGTWQRMLLENQTAPANADHVRIDVQTPTQQGITFYTDAWQMESGAVATTYLPKLFEIVENITNFSYDVQLDSTVDTSIDALITRELTHMTPAHINFTITRV